MPRQSADSLSVVPAFKIDLQPPAHLGAAAQAVFRDIVAGADRNHFRHEDRELLALYCALAFSDDEIELIADSSSSPRSVRPASNALNQRRPDRKREARLINDLHGAPIIICHAARKLGIQQASSAGLCHSRGRSRERVICEGTTRRRRKPAFQSFDSGATVHVRGCQQRGWRRGRADFHEFRVGILRVGHSSPPILAIYRNSQALFDDARLCITVFTAALLPA